MGSGKKVELEAIDVAPELPTIALRFNLGNLIRALAETPYGKQFPLPATATLLTHEAALVKGKVVVVNEIPPGTEPGKRVIIYKQGLEPKSDI